MVRSLVEAGHEVAVFSRRGPEGGSGFELRRFRGDRRQLENYREELRVFAPDVVVDMVAMSESDARGIVDVFQGYTERVVVISSMDVYRAYDILRGIEERRPDPTPLNEKSPLRQKLYPYDRYDTKEYEKILVEKTLAEEPGLSTTILRLPAVFGPGDYQHRLYPYLRRMEDGREKIPLEKGLAGWRWTRGYVENVSDAIVLAATDKRASGCTYNVGDTTLTEKEWILEIGRAAGWSGDVAELSLSEELLPESLYHGLSISQDLSVETRCIRLELGYTENVSREEALRRTVEWERANPAEDFTSPDYAAEDAALAGRD